MALTKIKTGSVSDSITLTTPDINGGTIDATVIGGGTPAAATFTTGTFNAGATFGAAVTVEGPLAIRNATQSFFGGLSAEVNSGIINLGVNEGSANRFGGAYTQANQGGMLHFDTRAGNPLFQLYGRTAGTASASGAILFQIDSTGNTVFNESSVDADFRVESNDNANMLFVDGGNNRVGIGKVPATHPFEVAGGAQFDSGIQLGGSGAANNLNDYEEGAWTPAITGSGGTSGTAYTTQVGGYTKVGNLVTADFHVKFSNEGTLTGTTRISGLPFIGTTTPQYCVAATTAGSMNIDADQQVVAIQYAGNAILYLFLQEPQLALAQISGNTSFTNTSEIAGSVSYFTNS